MSLLLLLADGGIGTPAPGVTDGLHIEIGFGSPPTTAQAAIMWTDVTSDVFAEVGVSIHTGRQAETDLFQPGSCSFSLNDSARKYDPTYTAGIYYGSLLPRRPVRVSYVISETRHAIFTGYSQSWPQQYDPPAKATVPLAADDGFRLLNTANLVDHFFTLNSATLGVLDRNRLGGSATDSAIELSGARIGRYLDLAGWPAADRFIDTGRTQISAAGVTGSGLGALQGVEAAEFGRLYMTPDGIVRFESRDRRIISARSTVSQLTFGDAGGTEVPYTGIVIDPVTDKHLVNDARRTGASGREVSAENHDSIVNYSRSTDAQNVPAAYDTDLLGVCQWIVKTYKDPQFRIEQLTVESSTTTLLNLLQLQISDRVTVKRRPQGVGTAISQDLYIEGIAVTAGPLVNRLVFDFFLSPVDTDSYFTLNTSTLNGSTVLGY